MIKRKKEKKRWLEKEREKKMIKRKKEKKRWLRERKRKKDD